jgi:hypothetical protein
MRWGAFAWLAVIAACSGGRHGSGNSPDAPAACDPACGAGEVCRYQACVPPPATCAANADCTGDAYCDVANRECLPWGIGPGGSFDKACTVAPVAEVAFPAPACDWRGPASGDDFPAHVNVLATPMVAAFDAGPPSIVFTAYNAADHASAACTGRDPASFGVIRVIDGQSCAPQATIGAPTVIAAAPVAVGDLGGDDATPEIVAARSTGGLVAFTRHAGTWGVMWQTTSTLAAGLCDWAGPALYDLDGDGSPEVVFYGAVYDGKTGAAIDESVAGMTDSTGVGYIPVVSDLDGDGVPELVTGSELYGWDKAKRKWAAKAALPGANGEIAIGDFGTFPAIGQADRTHTDGIAEVVIVYQGVVHVVTAAGREVFTANLQGDAGKIGLGGPPVVADFDGDGRLEIGVAGASAYQVLDPDCRGTPDPAACASKRTDGVLWTAPSQADTSDLPGSSAFDFDGDGKSEVVTGDACFARVHDGTTGAVIASRARTSCTWYDSPIVAASAGDGRARWITASSASCGAACPALDPIFDGVACVDDSDCGALHCGRVQASDPRGRCRCTADTDCGAGYACADPIAGASPAGKVCRAARTATSPGVHVLADRADRWSSALPTWNQLAYRVPGLNAFRANAPAATGAARADLAIERASVTCGGAAPVVVATVCNRGGAPIGPGVPVAVYATTLPTKLRCQATTGVPLAPGACADVSCVWLGPAGDAAVIVDDLGDGTGATRECRENNNTAALTVSCGSAALAPELGPAAPTR